MRDKGVRLMAGTDANNAGALPGFSLHDELQSMARAGMSPAQALRSATAVPGGWMKSRSGRLVPGYRADMVLLRNNPLEAIEHTRTIDAVVANGKYLDRAALDGLLDAVKEANDQSRTIDLTRTARNRGQSALSLKPL